MAMTERAIRPGADWQRAGDYEDIRFETAEGIAKITIDRPEVHNAFRPETLIEISDALDRAREDTDIGGHVLHVVCALTIAADNARFGQTGPKVGSFDGGFGAGLLAAQVGQKKAKEIWFLCRQYDADEALDMGLVNTVVPLDRLEEETVSWCREMLQLSPFALRLMKASFNAAEDGFAGIQQLAHDANLLFYASEEAREGREAYKAKRSPDFGKFPKRP